MTHDASIDLHMTTVYSFTVALRALLDAGWSYDDHGCIRFLPLHTGDQYDWQSKELSAWTEVERELAEKESVGETIGLALMWRSTSRGGEALFFREKLSLSVSSERLRLSGSEFTDFSWYIDKLVPPLIGAGLEIFRVTCTDNA